MTDWYWKNNFILSLLAMEVCLCWKISPRRRTLSYWLLWVVALLFLSSLVIQNWAWEGNTISLFNAISNVIWRGGLSFLTACQIYVCYNLSFSNSLYLMVVSFLFQKIQFNIYMILLVAISGDLNFENFPESNILLCLLTVVMTCAVELVIYANKRILLLRPNGKNTKIVALALCLALVMDFYNSFLFVNDPYAHAGINMIVLRGSSLLLYCLILSVLHNLVVRHALEMEKLATQTISKQLHLQYESSRELMQMINIKSHDLKKQLRYLRHNAAEQKPLIKEIENITSRFDAVISTNNEALSTILSEKSATCIHEGIPFTVVSCEHPLSFMTDLDIYTMFANLLDNSIEASRKLEPSKRSIALTMKCSQGFLSIHLENYFDGNLQTSGDTLLTSKKDVFSHGFGLQSIYQIVDRYNGIFNYKVAKNIFSVNILIPLPEDDSVSPKN